MGDCIETRDRLALNVFIHLCTHYILFSPSFCGDFHSLYCLWSPLPVFLLPQGSSPALFLAPFICILLCHPLSIFSGLLYPFLQSQFSSLLPANHLPPMFLLLLNCSPGSPQLLLFLSAALAGAWREHVRGGEADVWTGTAGDRWGTLWVETSQGFIETEKIFFSVK